MVKKILAVILGLLLIIQLLPLNVFAEKAKIQYLTEVTEPTPEESVEPILIIIIINPMSLTYGNNDSVAYTYDYLDRPYTVTYNDDGTSTHAYTYRYTNDSKLASVKNNYETYTTYYTYDLSGRLIEKSRSNGVYIRTAYDEKNLTTGVTYRFGGLTETMSYTYNENMDNVHASTAFTDGSYTMIAYDQLGRVGAESISTPGGFILKTNYTYKDRAGDATKTSGLISNIAYSYADVDDISYTYDKLGNITKITHGDGTYEEYTYDELNRLQKINYSNGDWEMYTYDNSGNITAKGIVADGNSTVISYTYGNSYRPDLLTKYNGTTITYDTIYNPLTYGSNTFTWNGRRMTSYNDGNTTTTYKYNEDGVRTSKTVGSTETEFLVDGTTILAQKTGSTTIPYYYDGNGKRIGFKYGGNMYFYVYNLQGDVTHILDTSKNIVGTYEYDAWGKILNIDSLTSIAQINPFRYRGYYYDTESGLYYLNSRYYNPEWGRFINTDDVSLLGVNGDFSSYNLFAYCGNNPIIRADDGGGCWHIVAGAIIGGGVELADQLISGCSISNINWGNVAIATIGGGASAAFGPIAGAFIDGGTSAIISAINGDSLKEIASTFAVEAVSSLAGSGASEIVSKVGGAIQINKLSKMSKSKIKDTVTKLYPNITGKERNAIKNVSYLLNKYNDVGERMLGSAIPFISDQIVSNTSSFGFNAIRSKYWK